MQAAAKLAERDPPPLIARPTKTPSLSEGIDVGPEVGRTERCGFRPIGSSFCGGTTSASTAARVALYTHFSGPIEWELSGRSTGWQPTIVNTMAIHALRMHPWRIGGDCTGQHPDVGMRHSPAPLSTRCGILL